MKNLNKKSIFLIFIIVLTVVLGISSVTIALKLYQLKQQPVAPSVPQSKPKASEAACTISFNITVGTITPTPSPTLPIAQCNEICNQAVNPPILKSCIAGLICWAGTSPMPGSPSRCRNSKCLEETDCTCAPPTTPTNTPPIASTPTPTQPSTALKTCFSECSSNGDCEGSYRCLVYYGTNRCLNPNCSSETDCGCNACWSFCSQDWECPSELKCLTVSGQKRCVNPNCSSEQGCSCPSGATSVPQATSVPTTGTTTTETGEEIPTTGIKIPTSIGFFGGLLLLSLGLALIF